MSFNKQEQKRIRFYFRLSILGKGIISLSEVLGGVLLFFVPLSFFTDFLSNYAQGELGEDSGDFIATHLLAIAQQFSLTSSLFVALYLLSRGLIKLLLIIALLKNQLWAYPLSLGVLGLFVLYQTYQIITSHSVFIIALTLFDLVVMWFIWREYEVLRSE
jgi:uncharacterized membrane protein